MGVELGKVLAKNILKQLDKPEDVTGHDSSVRTLILHVIWFLVADLLPSFLDYRPHPLLPEVAQGVSIEGAFEPYQRSRL